MKNEQWIKRKMEGEEKMFTHTYKMDTAGQANGGCNSIPAAIEQKFPMQESLSEQWKWVYAMCFWCLYTALAACVNQQNCIEHPGQTLLAPSEFAHNT